MLTGNNKTIVLSDIHFGVSECSIGLAANGVSLSKTIKNSRQDTIEKFIDFFRGNDINDVILLGDIYDLQLSNVETAINASKEFFDKLQAVPSIKNIFYIPGNHDHLLWFLHVFNEHVIKKLSKSPLCGIGDFNVCSDITTNVNIFLNNKSFLKNILGPKFKVTVLYPFMRSIIKENRYLFTHGHFFDTQQTLLYDSINKISKKIYSPFVAKLLKLYAGEIGIPNVDEMELYCSPLYLMFTMFGHTVDGREHMKEIYSKMKEYKWERDFDLDDEEFVEVIKKYLINYGGQEGADNYYKMIDYLIWGHTHHADINLYYYPGSKKLKVINIGCWLEKENLAGSFLFIDTNDEYPKLMFMDKKNQIFESKKSIEIKDGRRPTKKSGIFFR